MDHAQLPGIRGTLVSGAYASRHLAVDFAPHLGDDTRARARRALAGWWRRDGARLGPASSLRSLLDAGAAPVCEILGLSISASSVTHVASVTHARVTGPAVCLPLVVTTWGENLDGLFARAVAHADQTNATWAIGFNGRVVRLWDARRGWMRVFLDFDLETVIGHPQAFLVFWALVRVDALATHTRAIAIESDRHGHAVRSSLRDGVRDGLAVLVAGLAGRREPPRDGRAAARLQATYEQALTLIYRVLFLLFAESRSLVPTWHPVYRHSYTIESLRTQAEQPGRHRGIWRALQAVSRLANTGCQAGDLVVTPFNGRLFAPARTPILESSRLDDAVVARALVAITTFRGPQGRERITFSDLGVEQLGAVYESVLDYEPVVTDLAAPPGASRTVARPGRNLHRGSGELRVVQAFTHARRTLARRAEVPHDASHRHQLIRASGSGSPDVTDVACCGRTSDEHTVQLAETRLRRKSSGTFYTPREMTDYVVRQALAPLVADATPEQIINLRVVDPAMGSGAFLVAACHFLATAYERAMVRDRGVMAGDITDGERAGFRRLVVQRCLYGVDLNPMAVQVARLSLWLATLAAHKPLTFLDHHLAVGNSLAGASLDDVSRRPPGGSSRARSSHSLPLFPADEVGLALHRLLPLRRQLAVVPDDTAAAVRDKERILAQIGGPAGHLAVWKQVADVWCAGWFWDAAAGPPPSAGEFADMAAVVRGQRSSLPAAAIQARLTQVRRMSLEHRFFHWTLEFPEAFYQDDGAPRRRAGFDAVVTNPPWEMIRADSGTSDQRASGRAPNRAFLRFVRDSGLYAACDAGHTNLYQLFVERCLRLTRPGGRIGMIVPWGLASDHGSQALRHHLLRRCDTDTIVGFENTAGIFPIHRGVRFLLLSTSPGTPTQAVRCHFGLRDPSALDTLGETSAPDGSPAREDVTLSTAFLDTPARGSVAGGRASGEGVSLSPAFLARTSGALAAFPYLRGARDQRLLERLCHDHPALGSPDGWGLSFGRELNATDDRHLMTEADVSSQQIADTELPTRGTGAGIPVLEGKHIEPFGVMFDAATRRVPDASRLPADVQAAVTRWRLAYRDVASSTNRLTLIAALIPPGAVTVHTLFCLKTILPERQQAYLCAMFNSFVTNYLARLWVTTHVGASIIARLPVPMPGIDSDAFNRLADLAVEIGLDYRNSEDLYVEAQAAAASLYGLGQDEYAHILDTFPLVDERVRQRCLRAVS